MRDPEEVGPVEVAIILFDGTSLEATVAPALADLQSSGVVRIIDLAVVSKDADGEVAVLELEDAEVPDAFAEVAADPLDLLSDEDLTEAGAGLEPGSTALVVVWEDSWATGFARAVREANGEVIALERIPRAAVLSAYAALDNDA